MQTSKTTQTLMGPAIQRFSKVPFLCKKTTQKCSSQQKLDTPISIIRQPKARNYPCTASASDIRENKPDAVH